LVFPFSSSELFFRRERKYQEVITSGKYVIESPYSRIPYFLNRNNPYKNMGILLFLLLHLFSGRGTKDRGEKKDEEEEERRGRKVRLL